MTDYGSCLQVDPKLGLSPAAMDWGEIPYIKNILGRVIESLKYVYVARLALGPGRLLKAFHDNPIILQSK